MDRKRIWHMALWALAVSMLLAAVTLLLIFRFVLPPEPAREPVPAYTIGEWEGRVAVFEGDRPFPMQVYDTFVASLPAGLQQQVKKGIPAADADRLSVLLEDVTS